LGGVVDFSSKIAGPEAFDAAIRAGLAEFVCGTGQSDDITTIAFTYGVFKGI
jgi:hypothetical protein